VTDVFESSYQPNTVVVIVEVRGLFVLEKNCCNLSTWYRHHARMTRATGLSTTADLSHAVATLANW